MRDFRADLHIHTLLSPCGDLGMSPANIVSEAAGKGVDIIGVTDHNSTLHAGLISRLAARAGIFTMMGAEVTTQEEVHCLVFFENTDTLDLLQKFLDENLPDIKNDPLYFGDQVVLDEEENIIFTEPRLLTNAINVSIESLEQFVHRNNGLFIPAHIDRMKNSIYSQLGMLPENLNADAIEISRRSTPAREMVIHPELGQFTLITNSDSHFPGQIGSASTVLRIVEPSFSEIRLALKGLEGRKVVSI
jgi:3',5'-nucleoside bisphosphate phosphatase